MPLLIVLALVVAAGACGATDEAVSSESAQATTSALDGETEPTLRPDETVASTPDEPAGELGSYDPAVLEQARAEFDEARARWDSTGVTDYELVVSLSGLAERRTTVVDGAVVLTDETDRNFELAQTVEEIFAEADSLIAAAEADPKVDFNQCIGNFFNVSYDEELGYPRGWDSFSPCDDGVPYMAEVIVG